MLITLKRIAMKPGKQYQIGHLYVDGIPYCDTIEDVDRGLTQDMPLAEIMKRKIKSKTAIPRGKYRVLMNRISPKFSAKPYYWKFCKGKVPYLAGVPGFAGILMHCLTPDMEILTEHGWKNYEQFKAEPEENCYTYNTYTGEVELKRINQLIEQDYDGELYCCDGRIEYSVTNKHRMWVQVKKHDKSYEWEWRTADNLPTSSKFVTAGYKGTGWEISEHQLLLYRIIIAVQADGYILNWSKEASQVRFHFKKERKIAKIKELLDAIGDKYKVNPHTDGSTNITLSSTLSAYITEVMNPERNIYNTKKLPIELLSLKAEDMKTLLMDYLFWDGRWENYVKNPKCMVISSTNKNTIDILQAMAFMCGMRTAIYIAFKHGKWENVMDLKMYDDQEITQPAPETYSVKDYNGKVWCVSNDNHTIIVRKNGRPCVLGNCGVNENSSAGCIIVGLNKVVGKVTDSKECFERLYKKLLTAKDDIWIEIKGS